MLILSLFFTNNWRTVSMEQNLSLYRIFYTVAETNNISKAARKLYISQPAISKAISKLEDSLSTTLFIRSSRGVTLTNEGEILYEHVKTAFEALYRGENELTKIQELGIGHIKIGVSTTLCKYILLPYLKGFIANYPHINIAIENQASAQILTLLEQQAIDMGVLVKPKSLKQINFYPITEIQDIFVATPAYLEHLTLRKGPNIDIFTDSTIMLLDQKNMTRQYIDTYLSSQQISIPHLIEVSTMDLLVEFVKIGIGVGCIIREAVEKELEEGTLVEIPMPVPIPKRTIGFATSQALPITKSLKTFFQYITDSSDSCILPNTYE